MADANVDHLRPQMRVRALLWLDAMRDFISLRFPGFKVRISDTLRTVSEQELAFAAGLSKNKIGWHNFGLAFDFAVMDDKGVYVTDGKHPAYLAGGLLGMALNMRWGGNWDRDSALMEPGEGDFDHLEYHPGVTLEQMKAADAAAKNLLA